MGERKIERGRLEERKGESNLLTITHDVSKFQAEKINDDKAGASH